MQQPSGTLHTQPLIAAGKYLPTPLTKLNANTTEAPASRKPAELLRARPGSVLELISTDILLLSVLLAEDANHIYSSGFV